VICGSAIGLLRDRLDVLSLDGPTDYRMQRLGGFQTWHAPSGDAATEALSRAFFRLTDFPVEDRDRVPSATVVIKGGRELLAAGQALSRVKPQTGSS